MFFGKRVEKENAIDVNSRVEFSLLDPRATLSDLEKMCNIAYKNGYKFVCVNSVNAKYVSGYIHKHLKNELKVVSVVSFPLGATSTQTKLCEIKELLEDGVSEIDFVINIGRAKSGDFNYVRDEIEQIRKLTKKITLKAILETCYFDENEIIKLCKICMACRVDYIMTSTGFGTSIANENIISLIKNIVNGKCKIKASGGITTREKAINLINLGADRIGTSSII